MTELSTENLAQIRATLRDALAFTEKYITLINFVASELDLYPRIHRDAKVRKLEIRLQECIALIEAQS
jgi:hypothetical protein